MCEETACLFARWVLARQLPHLVRTPIARPGVTMAERAARAYPQLSMKSILSSRKTARARQSKICAWRRLRKWPAPFPQVGNTLRAGALRPRYSATAILTAMWGRASRAAWPIESHSRLHYLLAPSRSFRETGSERIMYRQRQDGMPRKLLFSQTFMR